MCGRFLNKLPVAETARIFGTRKRPPELSRALQHRADRPVLTVRFNPEAKECSLDALRWGLVLHWAKDLKIGSRRINARAEGGASTAASRDAFKSHRCIIPTALLRLAIASLFSLVAVAAQAQTDEIQVYNGEIDKPGEFSITWHNNYTPIGRKEPAFPGGLVPDHGLNGVPEYAYGVNEWLELGAYLPLYSVTRDGRFLINGGKLRVLFAVPHAGERHFVYAVNFELSYNSHHWATTHVDAEVRPIIGARFGPVDLIFNPIVDIPFTGFGSLDFAPAERLAYNFSKTWAVAREHYADYGAFRHFETVDRQEQALFAVVDYSGAPADIEFGIGHGFTSASDALVLKLMLTKSF